jgi:ABC-2 type transport system permease protein
MRIRTFVREPEALFWTFGFPILLAVGLGLAFREEAQPAPIPRGRGSSAVAEAQVAALEAAPELRPAAPRRPRRRSARCARRGRAGARPDGPLVFRFDPATAESREARCWNGCRAIQRGRRGHPPRRHRGGPGALPGLRYIDWLIPGLIGLNLMSTGMWGIGFGIVFMRQKKQLKRLVATPMRRSDFLLAQILARWPSWFWRCRRSSSSPGSSSACGSRARCSRSCSSSCSAR